MEGVWHMHLQEMTWKDVEGLDKEHCLAILPVGVVEQHGHHLPLGTDTMNALRIIDMATEGLKDAIVLPPINYGSALAMRSFPGTITVRPSTLMHVIEDISISLERSGFRKLLIANGHGGHEAIIETGIKEAIERGVSLEIDYIMIYGPAWQKMTEMSQGREFGHSCEFETAVSLHLMADLVRMDSAKEGRLAGLDEFPYPRKMEWLDWRQLDPTGVVGQPSRADRETGGILVDLMVEGLRQKVLELVS